MSSIELKIENKVAYIALNRPEVFNSFNREMALSLQSILDDCETNSEVRAMVLTGNGKAFCAGQDLKEVTDPDLNPGFKKILEEHYNPIITRIRSIKKPVIAAVNGFALGGGCELAMHADIIIAGESAKFGQPEVKVGIMAGGGGTQRLVRAVGKFKAMKMLLTGEPILANEALEMGLTSEVVADDQVLIRALELADKIAALPPLAIRQTKEVVLAGADCPLDVGLTLERKAFDILFDTEDQKEGMQAFIEKRKPEFKGK